ncbi:MAG: PLP-dependent aminotransferase family protein [Acidobacteria bacterium]|nr:MAG: PLP-dependent aminotransferase family protein [Acidobacteriota bacterium]
MARWDLALELDRRSDVPLYRQIAQAVTNDIRRGRLRPSDALPGTRTLARILGVQRLTVLAAYDELLAEGWIATRPARGTMVSPELPELSSRAPTHEGVPARAGFDVPPSPPGELPYNVPAGALLFAPNRPDVRLAPAELIGRAYRRALRSAPATLLGYGRPQGHERLREAIAKMLASTRAIAASADDICITRGSQMATALLARALIRPGDIIAVEELTYRPALETFRVMGARIVAIPLDAEGVKIEPIAQLAKLGNLRAIHVTPHHQFPTTVTLSAARRLRLLDLARTHRFAIFEEDYDHEFHYDEPPVLPLASADRWGVVAYIGTLSKVVAPALRVGYVVAPRLLLRAVIAHRLHIDVQGDRVLEFALAELMEQGEIQRAVRRARREYRARRDILAQSLRRTFGDSLTFEVPAGGIALWVRSDDAIDIDDWADEARRCGAVIATAPTFAANGRSRPFARLGFAALDRAEILEGVRRLAMARRRLLRAPRTD